MSLLATPKKSALPASYKQIVTTPMFDYQPMIQEMIDVYKRISRVQLTEHQTQSIKHDLVKALTTKKMLTPQNMADIFKACTEKIKPKKHVRFTLPDEDILYETFKHPFNDILGVQTITFKGDQGNIYIDVDKKGRREVYTMIDGKLHGTRYTTDKYGKLVSDEVFEMDKLIFMRTYYPSGAIKMHTYMNATRDTYFEICYYPNNKLKSASTFKLTNGMWIFADTYVEYNEAGVIISSEKLIYPVL